MKVGDLVRKFTSIKGVYNYGIVTSVGVILVKVAWANSSPKNPWIAAKNLEVVNASH